MRLQKYGTATHFLSVMAQDLMRVPGRKRALTLTCCLTWDDTACQKNGTATHFLLVMQWYMMMRLQQTGDCRSLPVGDGMRMLCREWQCHLLSVHDIVHHMWQERGNVTYTLFIMGWDTTTVTQHYSQTIMHYDSEISIHRLDYYLNATYPLHHMTTGLR